MKVLPTVPMVGLEAVGRTIQNLIAQKVIPAIERKGARIFFPQTSTPERFGFVHFSDWGTMGLRKQPYPAAAPFFSSCFRARVWSMFARIGITLPRVKVSLCPATAFTSLTGQSITQS